MSKTVYLKLNQITEIHRKDVALKDVAEVYCEDKNIQNKCSAMKVKHITGDRKHRYVMSALEVIEKLEQLDSAIQVNNVGEVDFIIAYQPPTPPMYAWQWAKTLFVCAVCFCGAAFAIMSFNNDSGVTEVFGEVYRLVMGQESNGFTVLEIGYSIGLALGIVVFFNHVAAFKLNTDPTPLEVEMRLYEDNISKTLIAENGRKESKIDVT